MLGVSGDGLKGQSVVARVEHVDAAKLKKMIGKHGEAIDLALDFADWKPKAAVDAAIPFIRSELAKIGVDAKIIAGDATTRGPSEFWGGLVVGTALGGSALVIWKLASGLFGRLVGGR